MVAKSELAPQNETLIETIDFVTVFAIPGFLNGGAKWFSSLHSIELICCFQLLLGYQKIPAKSEQIVGVKWTLNQPNTTKSNRLWSKVPPKVSF